jgi:precorrin-6B methylase 2
MKKKKQIREKIKKFWTDRSKTVDVPRLESQVNFQRDAKMADLYVKSEIAVINAELPLSNNDILVDLGAGNGRFSLLFAPKVCSVVAVEYMNDFTAAIIEQAKEHGYTNIEVISSPVENFCRENYADIIFVSGLLHYLDCEQYNLTINNISKTLKQGGTLFLRETISVLEDEFIVDKFSEELNAHYCSIYRTGKQHIEALNKEQFKLLKFRPFFEDGSVLNKRLETRLHYFVFKKT